VLEIAPNRLGNSSATFSVWVRRQGELLTHCSLLRIRRDKTIYLQILTFYRADLIRALTRIARDTGCLAGYCAIARGIIGR
jgi:hypothetical protein